jgi:hypothetical protein
MKSVQRAATILAGMFLILGIAEGLFAASPSKPFAFTGGTGISASQMNSNFDVLYNWESNSWTSLGGTNLGYNGWVGIGSSSPFCTMELRGTFNDLLMVNSSTGGTGNQADIAFRTYSGSGVSARIGAVDAGNHNGSLTFQVADSGVVSTNTVEAMRIISNGNVGIGFTSPDALLDLGKSSAGSTVELIKLRNLANAAYDSMQIDFADGPAIDNTETRAAIAGYIKSGGAGNLIFKTATTGSTALSSLTEKMRIDDNGYVGIGTSSPAYALDVTGSIHCTGSVIAGSTTLTSDERLKKDIQSLSGSLDMIARLRGVSFHWKDEKKGTNLQLGVIAQELEKVYPELVVTGADGFKSVNYVGLIAPMIDSIQTLKAENDDLKAKNEALEKRLTAIEKKLGL